MKSAILTGFEPFGKYESNPTQDLCNELHHEEVDDMEILPLVLPCSYRRAFSFLHEYIHKFKPEVVIGLGLASRIKTLRIETTGKNEMYSKYPDCDGLKPEREPIIPGARTTYRTNTNPESIVDELSKIGVPAKVSNDADSFICNSLIYLTAGAITEQGLPISFAYIHTPWTDDYRGKVDLRPNKHTIPKEDLQAAVERVFMELGQVSL